MAEQTKQTNQEMMFQGWWNGWDYVENKSVEYPDPSSGVSSVTIDDSGNLVVNGNVVGAVAVGSILDSIKVNDNNKLVISYHTEDSTETQKVKVDLSKFVDIYTAKESGGIIVDSNEISVDTNVVALKTDLSDYLTTTVASTTYQPIGNYVSSVSLDESDNNVYTLTVDGEAKGGFTLPDTSNLLDKETADETYQPKGTYVQSVELSTTDNNVYTLTVDEKGVGGFAIPDVSGFVSDVSLDTTDNNVYTLTVDGVEKGGFTLPSTEGLATEEEVNAVSAEVENNAGQIAALQAMVNILTEKVDALSQTNKVAVDLSNLTGDLTDTTADYVLSGTLSSTATITGKSITLDDSVVISNDNRLNLKANDVTINGSTISGTYDKNNGNSVIKIDECENVVIQNLTFDDTYSGYNGVEISLTQGGTTYPKNILFDGCEIGGTFANNALNVYATADNATVTVSNCHFANVSNCLRISNTTKATGVTFNVVNCTVDQWEHAEGKEAYYGFFVGQDYTSNSDEEAIANNLFGQDKITLNFTDLTHAGEKVCPSDPYSVCGVDDGTQVVYTYADKYGKWYGETDKEMYPVVTFA